MTTTDSRIPEDHEAALLAAYDEALACGHAPSLDEQALTALGSDMDELRADLACLEVLAQRWPRRILLENTARLGSTGSAEMTQLGRYRLLCELGRGGYGIVFLAYDTGLRRHVALKVPRPEVLLIPDLRQRFLREAHTAAGLDHPGLVPIYEAGEDGSVCYIASAYCPGQSLAARFKERPGSMTPRSAAQLLAASAKAVHYMHSRGVLHRDLKPANILLDADGTPRITDFGLAKQIDATADDGQTHTGVVLGTPAYMAPEQAAGRSRDISTASDVYALGAILYECLTGRPPFGDNSERPLLERVVAEEPAPLRRVVPGLARDLETICLTCLNKDSRRRYSSALALAEDLENWLEHRPIAARPAGTCERLVKWMRRRPTVAALACVSAVAVLLLLAGSLWHSQVLSRALDDLGHALDESDHLRREGLARNAQLSDMLYAADMRLAKEAWDNGDFTQLAELLDRHLPGDDAVDRRGFEWHWLSRCLGARVGTLKAHDGGLLCAAVSPNDQFLVTADRKGNVKVWDLESLQPIGSLSGHTNEVQRAVFSRDGRTLATCSTDQTVRLWDVGSWRETACLRDHEMTVMAAAFSPDGRWLASAGRDQRIVLWDVAKRLAVRSWEAHEDVVHDVAFTPDGHTLVSVSKDRFVKLWDIPSGVVRGSCWSGVSMHALALSPDGKTLAIGGYHAPRLQVWDLPNLSSRHVHLPSTSWVRALAFAPSGSQLAVAGDGGLFSIWDIGAGVYDGRLQRILRRRAGTGRGVAFARAGALLIAAYEEDGTVECWAPGRLNGWEELIPSLPRDIQDIALSPDGRRAASVHHEQNVYLLDLVTHRVERRLGSVLTDNPRLTFSPSGKTLAVAPGQNRTVLWEIPSGRELLTLTGHTGRVVGVTDVAFSPAGDLLITASDDHSSRVWDLPSGTPRMVCKDGAFGHRCLAFSPDGRTLAVGTGDSRIILWDPYTGERRGVLPGHGVAIAAIAFAPDGRTLAAGSSDGVIRLWNVLSGEVRVTFTGYRSAVVRLAFTPDGRTLATLGEDSIVKLWHPPTGQELFTLPTPQQWVRGLAFSADGQTLLAGTTPLDKKSPASLLLWRAGPGKP